MVLQYIKMVCMVVNSNNFDARAIQYSTNDEKPI